MMDKIPMTINGYENLQAEIKRLKTTERPQIIAAIAEARKHGDLSENAEYDAAKEKQSFIEGRIIELESKLASAEIIDPSTIDSDGRCVFGATVKIKNLASEQIVTYQIVGEDEADIKKGKVSIKSPIARGLIGKSIGDVAEVVAPVGGVEYEVLSITFV